MEREPSPMIFTHHGDYGDVAYQMLGVKHLCDEAGQRCTFYLSPANDTRERMTEEHAENLLPLLRAQPYIESAAWHPTGLGVRIDVGQRRFWRGGMNISDQMNHWLGLPCSGGGAAWLSVPSPNPMAAVVFSRSQRYRNPAFPWAKAYERFGRDACFIGTHTEHAEFEQLCGPVPIVATPTLLDVARVIAGARLFVGNQSCPRAIAEGLKIPVVVEMGRHRTCHFERPDAWYDCLPPDGFKV